MRRATALGHPKRAPQNAIVTARCRVASALSVLRANHHRGERSALMPPHSRSSDAVADQLGGSSIAAEPSRPSSFGYYTVAPQAFARSQSQGCQIWRRERVHEAGDEREDDAKEAGSVDYDDLVRRLR